MNRRLLSMAVVIALGLPVWATGTAVADQPLQRETSDTHLGAPEASPARAAGAATLAELAALDPPSHAGAAEALSPAASPSIAAQSGPYDDVAPDHFAHEHIAALEADGIFDGTECGYRRFCPGDHLPRWTMAVWLVRIIDGADPPAQPSRFVDVSAATLPANHTWWIPHVERLAQLGITAGCATSPARFCPHGNVNRQQMAAFLVAAFDLPPAPDAGFVDVDADNGFLPRINEIAAAGITAGCADNPPRFCPASPVNRDQMAVFLNQAINRQDTEARGIDIVKEPDVSLDAQINLSNVTMTVYYCGPAGVYDTARLRSEAALLEASVSEFYRRQSGAKTSVTFEAGEILTPNVNWSSQSISSWADLPGMDVCSEAASNSAGTRRTVVVLAHVPRGRSRNGYVVNGFAWLGQGPAVQTTVEQSVDRTQQLATIAHEIGHSVYSFSHPEDQGRTSFEELSSIMSNSTQAIRDVDGGHIACYQRRIHGWVGDNTCEIPALPPDVPDAPRLTPRDRSLVVEWRSPAENGSPITDYDVRYRRVGTGNWTQWRSTDVGTSQTTTITGLTNGVTYEVAVQAKNRVGSSRFSAPTQASPQSGPVRQPRVVLTVGDSAVGAPGADGVCTSVHCRWLNVEIENFGPGPHTLACAHNGIEQIGVSAGVYHSAVVADWPANRTCLFGYPGSEVFVVVGAERRGDTWYGGVYSNVVEWPESEPADDRQLRISWGSDASSRSDCPAQTRCWNLNYEFIGNWGSQPYTLECWDNTGRAWIGQWSGRSTTGCYYWHAGTQAHVIIDGIRSNTLTIPQQPASTRQLRISWGSDASSRSDCPAQTRCWNLNYEFIGNWGSQPYTLECWDNTGRAWIGQWSGRSTTGCYYWHAGTQAHVIMARRNTSPRHHRNWGSQPYTLECWDNTGRAWIGQWSGRSTTGCYYWHAGTQAHVIIDGIRSNTLTIPQQPASTRQLRISWGSDASSRSDCPAQTRCWNLNYEFIGNWGSQPYTLECWDNTGRAWIGQWSGRSTTGCYYWHAGTQAHVIIDGIRSNTLTIPQQPASTRQLRISWGSDASSRSDCPAQTRCWNLNYEFIGNWGSQPYTLECWDNTGRAWIGQWSGRSTTGCYYWHAGTQAHVIIDGIRSNTLTIPG